MKTTELFVELVIIGIGFFCVSFFFISIFYPPLVNFITPLASKPVFIIIFLSLSYVFGIIWDRVADYIFKVPELIIRESTFNKQGKDFLYKDFQNIRTTVYDNSETIKEWASYSRSRLRICRSWAIVFLLLGVLTPIDFLLSIKIATDFFNVIFYSFIIFFALSLFAWYRLVHQEYRRLILEYISLSKESTHE